MVHIGCQSKTESTQKVLTEAEKATYLKKGKEIASQTFTVLSTELQSAMQSGGVSKAISYCNLAAYPLVDSLSQLYQADIKRTSLKVRSEENKPTESEVAILNRFKSVVDKGGFPKPTVDLSADQEIHFYAPIAVNELCLKCHGTVGETITDNDYALIKQYYPEDHAINYSDGDLRGMWSITFSNMSENEK
jgi:hypothetical protein